MYLNKQLLLLYFGAYAHYNDKVSIPLRARHHKQKTQGGFQSKI